MTIYVTENRQTFPAAFTYVGMTIVNGVENPTTPINGYVHWSAYIFGSKGLIDGGINGSAYGNPLYNGNSGWSMFQCPSIENGGLPATDMWPGTQDSGQSNDSGANVVDFQAPRMAYTVNEAICPQNYFTPSPNGFQGASRYENYVRATQISNSSQTILGTEWNQNWKIVSAQRASGGGLACKSHRPVHAFQPVGGTADDGSNTNPLNVVQIAPDLRGRKTICRVTKDQLSPNPDLSAEQAPATNFQTRLDWVGRNHGGRKIDAQGRNLRTTNFLYVDGHVETKSIYDTLSPWQWGDQFYSLSPNSDVLNQ